jgi:hypothetical protein
MNFCFFPLTSYFFAANILVSNAWCLSDVALLERYERLEDTINKMGAKQAIQEFVPKIVASRTVSRERKALFEGA